MSNTIKAKLSKNMRLGRQDLENMEKEEIIKRFLSLQEHNAQLQNIIKKNQTQHHSKAKQKVVEKGNIGLNLNHSGSDTDVKQVLNEDQQQVLNLRPVSCQSEKKKRSFDFSKCEYEHVMIRLLYAGWNYQGYACVEDTTNTVENCIMEALLKTCLIESRDKANYHRCGRTDKGVSAFTQVISITVRKLKSKDVDVCVMLNRVLPEDIRAWGYIPSLPTDISARFNCISRSYRYFFPKSNLNIEAMNEGAKYLIGTHDFRNLCKMDVANGVTNFMREIKQAYIKPVNQLSITTSLVTENIDSYSMMELVVEGSGFLWHQIRCIMSVLIMVGQNLEQPDVVSKLLDVTSCPRKPQYWLSSDIGLCLFNAEYADINESRWVISNEHLCDVISRLQSLWSRQHIKSVMLKSMLIDLENKLISRNLNLQMNLPNKQIQPIIGHQTNIHKPLLQRNTCCSLEERIDHYSKRMKFN